MTELTAERLRELYVYNPESGEFWPAAPRRGVRKHKASGTLDTAGYRIIRADVQRYLAHRLAWLYMTGEWPAGELEVEHRNRDKDDNRWENLRLATRQQNLQNKGVSSKSLTGVKGVHPHNNGYAARIWSGGHLVHLGTFKTVAEAKNVWDKTARTLHGEFFCEG